MEQMPYQKVRTLDHKAVPYILKYLEEFDQKYKASGYLFPAKTQPRNRHIKTKYLDGAGLEQVGEYNYKDTGGYVYRQNATFWLNKINKQLPPSKRMYFHYGRHSIGIKMAYQGKSAIQIAAVLDETPRAAIEYTKHAGGLDQEWVNETE